MARPHHRISPAEVRRRRFRRTTLGRCGLDPAEVHDFLNRVADEMTALYRELAVSQAYVQLLRRALRARTTAPWPPYPADGHGWPGGATAGWTGPAAHRGEPPGPCVSQMRFIERHVPQPGSA
ncbi:MAG TPA: DivIVA domain-containing protein [Micromonospora sp.]